MPAYKNEKTGKWYCSFYYKDWTGKNIKKKAEGFNTKREALAFESDFKNKKQGRPDMTFNAMYELYMEDCKAHLRSSTIEAKEDTFNTHLLPYFGKMPVNEITPTVVRKWQNEMVVKNYKPAYLRIISGQLSAIFNFAVKYYNLGKNPVQVTGNIGTLKRDKYAIQFWTLAEYRKFIAAIPQTTSARYAIELLFYTGMRCGELLALTLADIDEGRLLTMTEEEFQEYPHKISITKAYKEINGIPTIGEPKTDSSKRIVTIPTRVAGDLKEYVLHLQDLSHNDRLFPHCSHWVASYIRSNAKKAGVKAIRAHDLRHSHASLLIDMGFSPLLIKERLGHEDIKTTLSIYSHLYPSKNDDLIEKLESL